MADTGMLVLFELDDGCRYSVHLEAVSRVVRAVAITPLPKAPAIVLGVIDVEGRLVPVVSLHRRFGLPERSLGLDDQIIIAQTPRRAVGLLVRRVAGVIEIPDAQIVGHATVVPGLEYVEGIVQLEDGLVCIHDLAACLSLDEERALDEAMEAHP